MKQTCHAFSFSAMSCKNEIRIFAAQREIAQTAFEEAVAKVRRIEQQWSRYRPDSVISHINGAAGQDAVVVDDETAAMIDYADVAWRESDGMFDITSGVLRRAWNFSSNRLPEASEVAALLPLVGWSQVRWHRPEILLPQPGMEIDFGGLGKEYAADLAATALTERGFIALVNLGGDMVATAPHPDGAPWEIGIRDPELANALAGRLPLFSGALATSGDYERCIKVNGRRYGHILDPHTGWPVAEGPASVSVIAPSCLVAGTLATLAMLKGSEATAWLDSMEAQHFEILH